jgi:hypothetical protein
MHESTPPSAPAHYTLWQMTLYFLKLGTLGFGGPVALVGFMHRDWVLFYRSQQLDSTRRPPCTFAYAAIQFASKNLSISPRLTGYLASNLSKSSPSTSSTHRILACCLAVPLKR